MWRPNASLCAALAAGLLPITLGCSRGTEPPRAGAQANDKSAPPSAVRTERPTSLVTPPPRAADPADAGAPNRLATTAQQYRPAGPPDAKMFPGLKQVNPEFDVWLDSAGKRVVLQGAVCLREGPIELFACVHRWVDDKHAPGGKAHQGTKEYESIVTVNTTAAVVHAALLLTGAEPGSPVKYDPYRAAHGPEIEVTLHWTDEKGGKHQAQAQEWVKAVKTGQAMTQPWVFAGSMFYPSERDPNKVYAAENGDFICVSNFPDAMLDLPVESSTANDALMFAAFTERIPPAGTPVTMVLTPKLTE